MKQMKILPVLLLCCTLLAGLLSCGGRSSLDKAVRKVLVSGDTTRAAYDSLCSIVTANPGRFGDLVTADGKVDHKKMYEFIDGIASSLRPPMHWDTRLYGGVEDLSWSPMTNATAAVS